MYQVKHATRFCFLPFRGTQNAKRLTPVSDAIFGSHAFVRLAAEDKPLRMCVFPLDLLVNFKYKIIWPRKWL